jgi:hypothetical protein
MTGEHTYGKWGDTSGEKFNRKAGDIAGTRDRDIKSNWTQL